MAQTVLPVGARGFDTASPLYELLLDDAVQDGISFVVKYVPYGNFGNAKFWTSAEIRMCFDRGLAVLAVFEVNGTRALGGGIAGWADGSGARARMRDLGMPDTQFIISAVDYDVWSRNSAATLDYVRAFASTCGAGCAVYGDEDVADGLIDANPIVCLPNAWGWSRILTAAAHNDQALMAAAAGIPGVCIYQHSSGPHYGINIDPLTVLQPVRAWCKDTPPPVATTQPHPPIQTVTEDKMATAHITVEGRYAQFYGVGTKLADGSVHCLEVVWSGPAEAGAVDNAFMRAHNAAPDIVEQHYTLDTMRGLVLNGCAASQIVDNAAPGGVWSPSDFRSI